MTTPAGYNVSLTYASAVSSPSTGPALPAPSTTSTSVSQWGTVSVGFAFSYPYQSPATTLNPAAVTATAASDGVAPWGLNLSPVYADAICQQSSTVTPSQQLTFFWG